MQENKADKDDDDQHKKLHFWHKRHEKEKEIATKRGEAEAYATVGGVGAVGWAVSKAIAKGGETALEAATDYIAENKKSTWKNIAFVAGGAAVGGFIYAGIKHLCAEKLQAELKDKDHSSAREI